MNLTTQIHALHKLYPFARTLPVLLLPTIGPIPLAYLPHDFSEAGLLAWSRGDLNRYPHHDLTFLEDIWGEKAGQPCTCNLWGTFQGYIVIMSSIYSVKSSHSAWINADWRIWVLLGHDI
jgi:hypothetical protein